MYHSEALWKNGRKLVEQGREEEAISQFLAAVEPDDGSLLCQDFTATDWYYRSLAEGRLGRNASAIASIKKACQSESTNWSFWYHRSGLLALNQEFGAGYESARKATSLAPDSPFAWRRLVELSLLSSQTESAWMALERMESLQAEPAVRQQLWWNLSRILLNTGQAEKAWQALNRGEIVGGETEDLALEILKALMTPEWLANFWDRRSWRPNSDKEFELKLSGERLREAFVNGDHEYPRRGPEILSQGVCTMKNLVLRYRVEGDVLLVETWKSLECAPDPIEDDEEIKAQQFGPLDDSTRLNILSSLKRITNWLNLNSSEHLSNLGKPATASDITDVELEFGHSLPPDLIEFLKVHGEILGVFEGWSEFGGLKHCLELWKDMRDGLSLDLEEIGNKGKGSPGVRNLWWDRCWFPIASNGSGDHLMVDLHPAKNGTYGQLIEWLHDDNERRLLAPSFTAWLAAVADSLESGAYLPE